jgi:hypothetical protein
MRSDFNKLLVERERIHHRDHFHNYRNVKGPKGLDDEEVGGRESMRKRYNFGYDRKSFNENLNPLWGWLRSCIGKNWDKCYSELCKTFDMRGVINAHILQHLWQEVEKNTLVGDKGQVMFVDNGRWASTRGPIPIKESYKDYYICPKDGTLKVVKKPPRRSVIKQKEAEARAKELAVKRVLSKTEVLHLIDGVWFHFDLLPVPEVRIVYDKPLGIEVFKTGYQFLGTPNSRREKTWDELNQAERERFGKARIVGGTAFDEFTRETVYRVKRVRDVFTPARKGDHYHANKKTASKKHLKQAGLA